MYIYIYIYIPYRVTIRVAGKSCNGNVKRAATEYKSSMTWTALPPLTFMGLAVGVRGVCRVVRVRVRVRNRVRV
jgi:hypothetical protein